MSRIRKVEISHFRSIQSFAWLPTPGINCIVGPGDAGKSTILDAIDLCLGARRNIQVTDRDFYNLDVESPIVISLTLGELHDGFKSLDGYGLFLRGFKPATGEILPEPQAGAEIVLTIRLTINGDLEPIWSLYSERAVAQQQSRLLTWNDRLKLSCTKLGAFGDYNFSWRKGSILNRISDERTDVSAELAKVSRDARNAFGDSARAQVSETLQIVKTVASNLGIPVGEVSPLLDAQSISLSGGTICLHNGDGVPLHGLGLGSTRLLITGLQRRATAQSAILLIDELEHGLEPHRIMRLIRSLGAKETPPPLQVFMTTHSPVAVCELSADQLFVLRNSDSSHELRGVSGDMQGTIRACPGALLASSIIVCEGASEIGLIRGLDLYRSEKHHQPEASIAALGVALADGNGENTFDRATTLAQLGYRTMVLRDNDKEPKNDGDTTFIQAGGTILKWREGRALEEELFVSLSNEAVAKLIDQAIENVGEALVEEHIKSASNNTLDLCKCRESVEDQATRKVLGKAAKAKKAGWFKSVSRMEYVGKAIVGPDLDSSDEAFCCLVDEIFRWTSNGSA